MRLSSICVLALFLSIGEAHAGTDIEATLSIRTGYTAATLAPDTNAQSSFYSEVNPGFILTIQQPRMTNVLHLSVTTDLYRTNASGIAISSNVDWVGFLEPSPRTNLFLSASFTEGTFSTFLTQRDPSVTPLGVTPGSASRFVAGGVQEGFGLVLSPDWRALQAIALRGARSLDSPESLPETYEIDHHLGLEREFHTDHVGLDWRFEYAHNGGLSVPGSLLILPGQQLINAGVLDWQHDFTPLWRSDLSGGVTTFMDASGQGRVIVQPIGQALLSYVRPVARIELGYSHVAELNLYIGQTFVNDRGSARVAMPLGKRGHYEVASSVGYQHGRKVDADSGMLTSTVAAWLADVGFYWRPSAQAEISARYQFVDQIGDAADALLLPTFRRNLVMIVMTGRVPGPVQRPSTRLHEPLDPSGRTTLSSEEAPIGANRADPE